MSPAPQSLLFAGAEPLTGRPRRTTPGPPRKRTAMSWCALGSGSGGNCSIVRLGDRALLVDAGFGPRTTGKRLAQAGLGFENLQGICLTHLDQDHFRPSWCRTLLQRELPIYLHHWHLPDLLRLPMGRDLEAAGLVHCFDGQAFEPMPGLSASVFRCQHDLQGTISYRLESDLGVIGHATDLGHVPPTLIDHLSSVDLLAMECNYDEHMTIHSPRPSFVNRRNMSDSGHLSNEQAFEAVSRIAEASPHGNPRHVVLLHRSSQCNHPTKIRRVFARAPHLARRVTLTEQRRRTRWITIRPMRRVHRDQLVLRF